jgi:hypothetical protein
MRNRELIAAPAALALLALAACTFEAGPTIAGADLAAAAADVIEEQTGARFDVDCGDDRIIVTQDKEVECVTHDPTTGLDLDTTVTFTVVDGDDWRIRVEVHPADAGASE